MRLSCLLYKPVEVNLWYTVPLYVQHPFHIEWAKHTQLCVVSTNLESQINAFSDLCLCEIIFICVHANALNSVLYITPINVLSLPY